MQTWESSPRSTPMQITEARVSALPAEVPSAAAHGGLSAASMHAQASRGRLAGRSTATTMPPRDTSGMWLLDGRRRVARASKGERRANRRTAACHTPSIWPPAAPAAAWASAVHTRGAAIANAAGADAEAAGHHGVAGGDGPAAPPPVRQVLGGHRREELVSAVGEVLGAWPPIATAEPRSAAARPHV